MWRRIAVIISVLSLISGLAAASEGVRMKSGFKLSSKGDKLFIRMEGAVKEEDGLWGFISKDGLYLFAVEIDKSTKNVDIKPELKMGYPYVLSVAAIRETGVFEEIDRKVEDAPKDGATGELIIKEKYNTYTYYEENGKFIAEFNFPKGYKPDTFALIADDEHMYTLDVLKALGYACKLKSGEAVTVEISLPINLTGKTDGPYLLAPVFYAEGGATLEKWTAIRNSETNPPRGTASAIPDLSEEADEDEEYSANAIKKSPTEIVEVPPTVKPAVTKAPGPTFGPRYWWSHNFGDVRSPSAPPASAGPSVAPTPSDTPEPTLPPAVIENEEPPEPDEVPGKRTHLFPFFNSFGGTELLLLLSLLLNVELLLILVIRWVRRREMTSSQGDNGGSFEETFRDAQDK